MIATDIVRALGDALILASGGRHCFPCTSSKRAATPHGFLDAYDLIDKIGLELDRTTGNCDMLQVLRPLTTNANDDGTGTSHVLFRDIETRSTLDLKQVGAHRYATHTTEVLCVGFAVDDEPADLWTPGNPVPAVFIEAAHNGSWVVSAHPDAFESAIEQHILAPQFDWPLVPIKRHRCTMAMALALALPANLDGAAAALGLPGKDLAGHKLMLAMSKPRKPRTHEDPALGPYWVEDLDRRQRLHAHCKQDVELLRLLYRKLRPLVPSEQKLWELDSIINARGIAVDVQLVSAALSVEQAIAANLNTRLAKLTDGAVERVTQGERLKAWLEQRGCTLKSLTKHNVAASLVADDPISLPAREALEIRQAGAKASTRKLPKLLACCGADARARGLMQFHRASTGRWSGQRLQPQNLPRPATKDVDAAIATLRTGDAKAFSAQYPFPLSTLSDCIRGMLIAPPRHRLIAGDYSGIESRAVAWIAGEQWKIDAHAAFDAGTGPEPYLIIAADIHGVPVESLSKQSRERAVGKTADLYLGYAGGIGAWRAATRDNPVLHAYSDERVRHIIHTWRAKHPAIVNFWDRIDCAAIKAVRHRGDPIQCGRLTLQCRGRFLFIKLPSGRSLAYPEPSIIIVQNRRGDERYAVSFMDNAQGKWLPFRNGRGAYGGIFTNHVVQGMARDLLAAALLRLEAAGYPVVLHVHDEAVCELPDGVGSEEELQRIMAQVPDWAAGLPIAVSTWSGQRYRKD